MDFDLLAFQETPLRGFVGVAGLVIAAKVTGWSGFAMAVYLVLATVAVVWLELEEGRGTEMAAALLALRAGLVAQGEKAKAPDKDSDGGTGKGSDGVDPDDSEPEKATEKDGVTDLGRGVGLADVEDLDSD